MRQHALLHPLNAPDHEARHILCMLITLCSLLLQIKFKPFAEPAADAGKWSSLNSQARNALGCKFVAMVLGFLSTLVLGQGVLAPWSRSGRC